MLVINTVQTLSQSTGEQANARARARERSHSQFLFHQPKNTMCERWRAYARVCVYVCAMPCARKLSFAQRTPHNKKTQNCAHGQNQRFAFNLQNKSKKKKLKTCFERTSPCFYSKRLNRYDDIPFLVQFRCHSVHWCWIAAAAAAAHAHNTLCRDVHAVHVVKFKL